MILHQTPIVCCCRAAEVNREAATEAAAPESEANDVEAVLQLAAAVSEDAQDGN